MKQVHSQMNADKIDDIMDDVQVKIKNFLLN